jgi:uncharacterized membrane protein
MTTNPFALVTSLAALAGAAAGGMMYVFSTFVMRGLDRTGPVDAITAMRGINAEANANPGFLLAYFGATVLALVVAVLAAVRLSEPGNGWILVGAICGVLGAVITVAFNVPLNNHLDTVDLAAAEGEWRAYFATWTAWNHARAATGFIGAALMLVGLQLRG